MYTITKGNTLPFLSSSPNPVVAIDVNSLPLQYPTPDGYPLLIPANISNSSYIMDSNMAIPLIPSNDSLQIPNGPINQVGTYANNVTVPGTNDSISLVNGLSPNQMFAGPNQAPISSNLGYPNQFYPDPYQYYNQKLIYPQRADSQYKYIIGTNSDDGNLFQQPLTFNNQLYPLPPWYKKVGMPCGVGCGATCNCINGICTRRNSNGTVFGEQADYLTPPNRF